ncbi:hypothetical protein BE61_44410 [Bradyrhizobium elkanii USDA 61]|nr:hypothetical protein BE61_44410 [Bradyrhizobium elkanii USDA 61]
MLGGISKSSMYNYMTKFGFPFPIELGKPDGRVNKPFWYEDEVIAWIASRPRKKIGGLKDIQNRQGRPPRKQQQKRGAR